MFTSPFLLLRRCLGCLLHSKSGKYFLLLIISLSLLVFHSVRVTNVDHWRPGMSLNLAEYVMPDFNTTIIFPENLFKEHLSVLFVIHTAPGNFAARRSLRETLFRSIEQHKSRLSMRAVFFIGNAGKGGREVNEMVRVESYAFGDLIVEDFVESYANLTVKTVMMLKTLLDNGARDVKYVFKLDDDLFVNVPMFVKTLLAFEESHGDLQSSSVMLGFTMSGTHPIRWTYRWAYDRKWILPSWMLPQDVIPDYMSGCGYLFLTSDLPCLYRSALSTPLVYMEDIFLTGLVSAKCNVKHFHLQGMNLWKDLNATNFVTTHYAQPGNQRSLHRMVEEAAGKGEEAV